MPFATALSQHPEPAEATGEVVGRVLDQLGDGRVPDLAVLFCSPGHRDAIGDMAGTVRALVSPRVLIGAAAGAVIGGPREVEDGPAVSLWAATLPAVPRPVRVTAVRTPSGVAIQGLPVADLPEGGTLILLVDPYSLPVDEVLDAVDATGSGVRVVGGLASAAAGAGGNRLVLDDEVVSHGAVGVLLDRSVATTTVVSQGCRPVGDPMIVTRADGNVLAELAGKPALERVAELAEGVGPEDRALLATGLHIGVAVDEHKETFGRGDFLIRAVLGADRATKALVVGDTIPVGRTVQFQVRDAAAADEDLHALLAPGLGDGALLFTCNGRGTNMFDGPDHDARAVADAIGSDAVAGMSCAGELGPVGGRSYTHGFTASVVLFPAT
ncbi:MAG TPA: FIST N-terminal domain-containing protein [Acidimicrobiales bacterium]